MADKYTQTPQHRLAYDLLANTRTSFFLTGRAGTGKTTFLRQALQQIQHKKFMVLAPTGIAAIIAGGVTIHSMFGLELGTLPLGSSGKVDKARRAVLRNVDTIIVDEVSMVRCDVIDAMDLTLRKAVGTNLPFGGKQMVFIGDLQQLQPVLPSGVETDIMRDCYGTDTPYFYKARVFGNQHLPSIQFEKVFRQEDKQFLEILNQVRDGVLDYQGMQTLNTRVGHKIPANEHVITLATTNAVANSINMRALGKLDAEAYTFEGDVQDDFSEKAFPVDEELTLKEGAQVMFVRNNPADGWVNGTLGTVVELDDSHIVVETDSGKRVQVEPTEWEAVKYVYNAEKRQVERQVTGTYRQIPLKLAWAITIHKSQGLTFTHMALDLTHGTFSDGQLYVALSRVKSLDGLYLKRPITVSDISANKEILRFSQDYNNQRQLEAAIERGKVMNDDMAAANYDALAQKLLASAYAKAVQGDLYGATAMVWEMLRVVVSDHALVLDERPDIAPLEANTTSAMFLSAVFALYHKDYDAALRKIDALLAVRTVPEAYYIKVRAQYYSGRYKDASKTLAQLASAKQGEADIKTDYALAQNLAACQGEAFGLFIDIMRAVPDYMPVITELRRAAHAQKLPKLAGAEKVVSDFNDSKLSHEAFEKRYKNATPAQYQTLRKALLRLARSLRADSEG